MGLKKSAKTDAMPNYGPSATMKQPFPGVKPGTGGVSSQENPRRQRRESYTPKPQPRETGVQNS